MPHRCRHREGAQALLETSLVLPLFLLLFFGIIDMGRLIYIESVLNGAAHEGARIGVLPGAGMTDCPVIATVTTRASGLSLSVDPASVYSPTQPTMPPGVPAANTGLVYIYQATASGPAPTSTVNCSGTVARGSPVTVIIRFSFVASTPVIGQFMGPVTVVERSTLPSP